MNSRANKILVWLLSWAVLLLIVMYSPIGSPEMYIHDKTIVQSPGVSFAGGIINAPKVKSYQQNDHVEFQVPEYSSVPKTYSVKRNLNTTSGKVIQPSYGVMVSVSHKETGIKANSVGNGVFPFVCYGSVAQSKPATTMNAISTLTADVGMTESSVSTRQLVATGGDGGTDPGGDPEGTPIPLENNYWTLMMMAIGYAAFKLMIIKNKVLKV